MTPTSADRPPDADTALDVRPFRALTYRETGADRLGRVSSPAYDLVTAAGRERLAAADPHNIVRLILPRVEPPPGDDGTEAGRDAVERQRATLAARTLHDWESAGVLERRPVAGFWRYAMHDPQEGITEGWLAAVRLPAPGTAAVLPHEDTVRGAVEGRRALLAATRTDLEPIVLAHDPDEEVSALTAATGAGEPTLQVQDADGVTHRLWEVTAAPVVTALRAAFGRTCAVIADGHHRFAAAQADHRTGTPGSGAVLALLTPMGPGGLRVRAIHRVLPGLPLADAVAAARHGFTVTPLPAPLGPAEAVRRWSRRSAGPGFLLSDGRELVQLTQPTAATRAAVPGGAPPAWRALDVVLAHHGLITALWGRPDTPESVLVAHDLDEALRAAQARQGTALLLRSPSPADVAAVARAGARMPRKSTLFVPKPRSGLVMRPHDR